MTTTPNAPQPPAGQDETLAAALGYARRGWHVLPILPGTKRPAIPRHDEASCPHTDPYCARAGRHLGWESRATTRPERIMHIWSVLPDHGIGIACGPSRLVVIDCDTPKGDTWPDQWRIPGLTCGADVLTYVAESLGEQIPATYTIATPSGGRHLYFQHPTSPGPAIRNTIGTIHGPLGWLVDVRATGGQVLAPPTTGPTGSYTVLDGRAPAPLPDWIAHRLRRTPARPATTPTDQTDTTATPDQYDNRNATTRQPRSAVGEDPWAPSRRRRYLDAAIDAEATRVREAVKGERNHTLFRAAAALGELVAGGELDADHVRDVLLDASATHLTDPDYPRFQAGQTITSGLRHGATRPRRYAHRA